MHETTTCLYLNSFHIPLGVPSISILSRHPSFYKTTQDPGETARGFCKERWLKRMEKESTVKQLCPVAAWKVARQLLQVVLLLVLGYACCHALGALGYVGFVVLVAVPRGNQQLGKTDKLAEGVKFVLCPAVACALGANMTGLLSCVPGLMLRCMLHHTGAGLSHRNKHWRNIRYP